MNINKLFELAKNNNIEALELDVNKSTSFSVSLFRGEIDNYELSTVGKILARGIYQNKLGFCATEKDDKSTPSFIINSIKDSASLIEKKEIPEIFKGSEKYSKKNMFSKSLESTTAEEKIDLLRKLYNYTKTLDPRISEVEVSYNESMDERLFANSYGLKLKDKSNYFVVYCNVYVKDNNETKDHYEYFIGNDLTKFDYMSLANKATQKALETLHGSNVANGTYNVVMNNDCVSSLLMALLSNLSAEAIQKHTSKFEGKLNTQIVSNKLTITEKPLTNNIYRHYFDDEGVACKNKVIINKGELKTYFYNLETAKKDGVESTGNAYRAGGKMSIAFSGINIKPGKLTEEQLFQKIKNGLYITNLSGLHAGLNPNSGDFSLESNGFKIINGKKDGPLGLFVLSGNIFKLFNNVIAVGNNLTLLISSNNVPSIAFKNLKYSAE